jgi:hypothetical protein
MSFNQLVNNVNVHTSQRKLASITASSCSGGPGKHQKGGLSFQLLGGVELSAQFSLPKLSELPGAPTCCFDELTSISF